MTLQLEPDVAFGMHPDYGVAAAVADARPFLDEVLRKHHFRYSEYLDVYLLRTTLLTTRRCGPWPRRPANSRTLVCPSQPIPGS